MNDLLPFLGCWADHPSGPPGAVLTLIGEPAHLYLHSRWTDAEGQRQQVGLVAVLDGHPHPVPGAEGLTLTSTLAAGVLATELRQGDQRLRTTRRISPEGHLLVQEEGHPERPFHRADVKQVLVYRRDLQMRKGKIAAQCAHATMAVFTRGDSGPVERLDVLLDGPSAWWARRRMAKVVLSVDDEPALLAVYEHARRRGLPCAIITDAGRTEFKGVPTKTTVAVGPALVQEIDEITGPGGLVETKLA